VITGFAICKSELFGRVSIALGLVAEFREGKLMALLYDLLCYPQRHPVTESSYNNSLADRHIWSTIKTLPATLPEPSSEVRGPLL
jgi:hypothetical protein